MYSVALFAATRETNFFAFFKAFDKTNFFLVDQPRYCFEGN